MTTGTPTPLRGSAIVPKHTLHRRYQPTSRQTPRRLAKKNDCELLMATNRQFCLSASLSFDSEPAICEGSAFGSIGRQCCDACYQPRLRP